MTDANEEVAFADSIDQVYDVDEFDDIYANYQDAKAKMNALRNSRGFYPVVAMLPQHMPGSSSGPARKGGGKSKSSKGKNRANPKGGKAPNPKGRAAAAMGNNAGDKKRKANDDLEAGVNMVEDIKKYIHFLLEEGFDIHNIPMFHSQKGFKYGNSMKETTDKCIVLPIFLGGRRIDVLPYVIKGTAPILIGRPLLEQLGLTVDYRQKLMKWPDSDWEPLPVGARGEHLLHLGKDIRKCLNDDPQQVLLPEDTESHVGEPLPQGIKSLLEEVMTAEDTLDVSKPQQEATSAHTRREDGAQEEEIGVVKRLQGHVLRKMEKKAEEACRAEEQVLRQSTTINKDSKCRVVWEVFGAGRTSKYLNKYPHVQTEIFSLQTGWDFRIASHRSRFLSRLRDEQPDEVMMSPKCRLWSPIQELNIAKSEKYKSKLAEDRQYNHDTILTMCSIAFQEQFRGGREATLEHPWLSRAWNTRAFACLEEISHHTYVDQCMYGLQVPDHAGVPGLARKPTCFRTTKASLSEGLTCQCDGSHIHVPIEGNAPGGRSRSSIAEDYPEKLAKKLAYLMQKDPTDDQIFAAEEDEDVEMPEAEPEIESKQHIEVLEHDKQHVLPKELFDDGAGNIDPVTSNALLRRQVGKAAMNYVVRLHRNLGHPGSNVLCKMLEEVQATQNVMNAAKDYVCPECFVRQGPAGVPPAAGLTARVFGERLMADTAWIDTDDGAALMYQRGRSEEGRPMSSASPSTEVPECPSVTGEDQEMKNDIEEEETAATCCKSAIIVDAKALFDSLKGDGIGSAADKRAGIEILCIKEEIKRLRTELRWVSSERMLADGLTKSHTRQQLAEMLKSGWLSIVHDENYVAAKKKNKEERQTSTAQTFGYTNQVAARISMVVALSNVAQTAAQNMTEVGEQVDVVESFFADYAVDYAFIVTVISLIVGTPLIAEVQAIEVKSREALPYILYTRATGEFTTLGILAFIVWICWRSELLRVIYEICSDVEDIALPQTAVQYLHSVENTHMHLFLTFLLYFLIMTMSLVIAQNIMKQWAASLEVYDRERRCFVSTRGKAGEASFNESQWSKDFLVIRQTFLDHLPKVARRWDFFDQKVGDVLKKHNIKLDDPDSLPEFLTPWFPFSHYVLENYRRLDTRHVTSDMGDLTSVLSTAGQTWAGLSRRDRFKSLHRKKNCHSPGDMLDYMVEIHMLSLACLAIAQGGAQDLMAGDPIKPRRC
ncbi:Iron sulfur cluster assembly protein 1 [Durusdinium trenchii]|uniref:Mitochondrial n=1 Tax=Durusdinium trenchii TaxID=1381693 RepID=A0ABP0J1I0_9DINO